MTSEKLKILDLFSGIGGFSLGLERTGGFETVAFCEIEPFPRKVLAKHWPEVPQYEDVTKLTGEILARDGIAVDVITGGFPCQDISVAGKQAGISDGTRSGLWSEIVRLIGELSPRYVIVENVANLLSGPSDKRGGWFGRILGDLAECGYDAEWENIPAASVGAPHRRERVWIVAYPNAESSRREGFKQAGFGSESDSAGFFAKPVGICGDVADTNEIGLQRAEHERRCFGVLSRAGNISREADGESWKSEPAVGRVANGVPQRVDRLKGLGNAVVPQIPELIGRAIMAAETKHTKPKREETR